MPKFTKYTTGQILLLDFRLLLGKQYLCEKKGEYWVSRINFILNHKLDFSLETNCAVGYMYVQPIPYSKRGIVPIQELDAIYMIEHEGV